MHGGAFLGLGSNLGDRRAHLRAAVDALQPAGDVVAVSPLYETEPVGGPAGQEPYLNLVVELRHRRFAPRACSSAARPSRRPPTGSAPSAAGPRTLDVDVLWWRASAVDEPDLVVPHPRMWERRFVLAPLADLAPDLVTPSPAGGRWWRGRPCG